MIMNKILKNYNKKLQAISRHFNANARAGERSSAHCSPVKGLTKK